MSDDPKTRAARAFSSKAVSTGSTRDRILEAAISVIERDGAERATVRAIAAEAGVNLAAINYHYRSKEDLMEAAIASTWSHATEDLLKFLEVEPADIGTGVEALILYLLKGGKTYPNVTRAHLLGAGSSGAYEVVLEGQRRFVEESARVVTKALGVPFDDDAVTRTSSLYFFCLYSAIVPGSLPAAVSAGSFGPGAALLAGDYIACLRRAAC